MVTVGETDCGKRKPESDGAVEVGVTVVVTGVVATVAAVGLASSLSRAPRVVRVVVIEEPVVSKLNISLPSVEVRGDFLALSNRERPLEL